MSERFKGAVLKQYRDALEGKIATPLLASRVYDDELLLAGVVTVSQITNLSAETLQQRESPQDLLEWGQTVLSEEHCRFLSQQVLCFLCTVNRQEQCAVVAPNYAGQLALCVSGAACVVEPGDLRVEVARGFTGAKRIIALTVQRVEVQSGDWSATLAYERARVASIWTNTHRASACSLK